MAVVSCVRDCFLIRFSFDGSRKLCQGLYTELLVAISPDWLTVASTTLRITEVISVMLLIVWFDLQVSFMKVNLKE